MDHASTARRTVVDAIRDFVPPGVALAGGLIGAATSSPFPEEDAALQRSVDKRRREFVAGREYARAAMAQLGRPAAPIAVRPSRAPYWPEGLTGSISHSGDTCVAAVAATSNFVSLGIDIEFATPLSPELHATVCSADELASPAVTDGFDPPKVLFAVKEAFFKFYHPVAGHFLDFLDVNVSLDVVRSRFSLQLRDELPSIRGSRSFEGIFGLADCFCFAFITQRS